VLKEAKVEFDKAYDVLNKLVLCIGRRGGGANWLEVIISTGYTDEEVKEAFVTLEKYGMLKPSASLDGMRGYMLDVSFVEQPLQKLVDEGKLVSYSVANNTYYVKPS
jgi:hypothetical protein